MKAIDNKELILALEALEKEKEKDINQENKMYVYLEDEYFRKEAENNKNAEILNGPIEEIIDKVKGAKCASIYTRNSNYAYEFINLTDCKNVFVNTNVGNSIGVLKSKNEFYKYKNIIIPVPKAIMKKVEEINDEEELNERDSNEKGKNTMPIIEYKQNLWDKIKQRFKIFLGKS